MQGPKMMGLLFFKHSNIRYHKLLFSNIRFYITCVCEIVSRLTLWTEVMITVLETNRYSWPLKIDALVGRWFGISFSGVWPIFQGQKTAVCFRESVYILTSHGNISPDVPMNCINHSLNFLACSIQQLDKGASWRLVFPKPFPALWSNKGNALY